MNNFDFVAPFYDKLSRLVFGKAMQKTQTAYLHEIPPKSKVLILGGGTGWLLKELADRNPTCYVWYIEASAKMIELSMRKTKTISNEIVYIHGTEDSIPEGILFDAVVTHFFFDLFSNANGGRMVEKIQRSIHGKTIWLVADFVNTTWWHSAMLAFMYRFFKIVSSVKIDTLSNWEALIQQAGFREVKSQLNYGSFIKSVLFRAKAK